MKGPSEFLILLVPVIIGWEIAYMANGFRKRPCHKTCPMTSLDLMR
jgi:hypothetical protein